ncbi:glycosyltransferase [Pseudomonas sp. RIT-PI-AD]|uniref:glycosyltransferase n=1 Tax=Pseudomonas sp. RIT-PI-AD TaxID=3035294 RepID=UPI0021D95B3A|nr:glycosyltransferase [Pseudomonas sp. RIT-PI-AD]
MIGIVIPAHNEEELLGECLRAVLRAAAHPGLEDERVEVVAVLDSCTDQSATIAEAHGVFVIEAQARNVGQARALGADFLIDRGARWIACTDADSRVAEDWLVAQLALQADAVCGTVRIEHWHGLPEQVRVRYESAYEQRDGHRHIHGANLGVSASAYLQAGGFQPLSAHEDVELVRELERCGACIAWSSAPQVFTSTRLDCRATGGFGDYLKTLF